jgi:hypothetical protein
MADCVWYTSTYYVDKTSGTSADQLLAAGVAALLQKVLAYSPGGRRVFIGDAGPHYTIDLPRALTADDVERVQPFTLVRPLRAATSSTAKAARSRKERNVQDAFDYDEARAERDTYNARLKLLPTRLRSPDARLYRAPELAEIPPPHEDLPLYTAMRWFKVVSSVNDLIAAWQELPAAALQEAVRIVLRAFHATPNDLDGAAGAWAQIQKQHTVAARCDVTLLQMLNPVSGKGANRPKAASTVAARQLDGFWLSELLKLVGYFRVAAPLTIQGTKDRKTYVLRPRRVELDTITAVMNDFRAVLWSSTAVKLDVLAALRFVEVYLVRRERAVKEEQSENPFEDVQVTSMVEGFDVTFAKDMGSALATMNMATLNLPGWLPPATDLPALARARALLREHLNVIRAIGSRGPGKPMEEGAEEYALLRDYRDFLSSRGDLTPFGRFAAAYGPYLLAQRDRGRYAVQFTTENLEVLMDAQKDQRYRRIVDDAGFRAIAGCIRQATVIAQYRTAQLNDHRYEVRYGLGQELARKAGYPGDFLKALGAFLQSYSAEISREEEKVARNLKRPLTAEDRRAHHLRFPPSTQDMDAIITLIDEFDGDSELICSLLLAYGYARDVRDPATAEMVVVDEAGVAAVGAEDASNENE